MTASENPPPEPPQNGSVDSLVQATGRAVAPWLAPAGEELGESRGALASTGPLIGVSIGRSTARPRRRPPSAYSTTETTKRVWDKVLESEEAQKLVERVADAPEVRAAITSQGIGLLEDMRRGVRSAARRVDTVLENGRARVLRRPQRERRPIYAGSFSRLLALAIDAGVVYGSLLLISAAIAALISVFSKGDHHAGTVVFAIGALHLDPDRLSSTW